MRPAWTAWLLIACPAQPPAPRRLPTRRTELHVQRSPYPLEQRPLPPASHLRQFPPRCRPSRSQPKPQTQPRRLSPLSQPVTDYHVQSGDTLHALARRFQAPVDAIQSDTVLLETGFLSPGLKLLYPWRSTRGETLMRPCYRTVKWSIRPRQRTSM